MRAAHVTAPTQLPQHISPQNHPYSHQTRCLISASIRHHRTNITPLDKALMQNAAI